ncbi:hypothetical protein U8607_02270 [Methylobacterium durans]|uniref:hypothetical protein n=1 Tax=Methylobacterium durans TaxID=2202825 RepID=UPI002AFFE3CA|nr:hypothetical protein [Methylobacterium durans]MEA1830897.1 hypothetical protein [Methylobacterium durans]
MAQRFTVIAGGLTDAETRSGAPRWRIDLRTVNAVDAPTIAAWRALLTRTSMARTAFLDPDFILPAAKHQSGGRSLVLALAWCRRGEGPESLRGALPLVFGHPLWRRGRVSPWSPPGLGLRPGDFIEAGCGQDILTALDASLRRGGRRLDLVLDPERAAPARRFEIVQGQVGPTIRRAIPEQSLIGVRAASFRAEDIESISEPERIRDAVETFLDLDARSAARPIIADPSEAAMVRVVTRLFARRRAVSVDLARRSGEVVAGSLSLGVGRRMALWRSTPVPVRPSG